ncbi:MAG: DEAD/DEAH box helicase [Firmicutes bacterium]|nr:DEAD/DEAH box helicase [Bacillota bacterium]
MQKFQLFGVLTASTKNENLRYGIVSNLAWLPYVLQDLKNPQIFILTFPTTIDILAGMYQTLPTRIPKRRKWKKFIFEPYPLNHDSNGSLTWSLNQSLSQSLNVNQNQVSIEDVIVTCTSNSRLFTELLEIVSGRQLSYAQLVTFLRGRGWWPSEIQAEIERALFNGVFEYCPAISTDRWGQYRCNRCNSIQVEKRACIKCGRIECGFCLGCQSMGELRACDCLIFRQGAQVTEKRKVELDMQIEFSEAQRRASFMVVDFVKHSSKSTALIWAACGAGKTEVVFPAIKYALMNGEDVLFAIPRREIVRELAERLQKNFVDIPIAVHYGGQSWYSQSPLVVATTHQVLRFYRKFGLVVLDEVDAFPYHGNEVLRFAIKRALKPSGKLIEMSATPRKQRIETITIPARHHGYPLPEPYFLKCQLPHWRNLSSDTLPREIIEILTGVPKQWLVFVPTVESCEYIAQIFQSCLQLKIEYCHSLDPKREQKINSLQHDEVDIFVTTSILERGVTISDIQVMVLYADHPIFSEHALIQMAGRVGRRSEAPTGKAVFVASKNNLSIKTAIKNIKKLNELARSQGLLNTEEV